MKNIKNTVHYEIHKRFKISVDFNEQLNTQYCIISCGDEKVSLSTAWHSIHWDVRDKVNKYNKATSISNVVIKEI
jgi:thiamine pyrophosphokinase